MANREMTRRNKKLLQEKKYVSEEEHEIKRFVIILFSIIICIVVVYAISKVLVKKEDTNTTDDTVQAGAVDYNVVAVGSILNRPEKEYYVLVYNQEDSTSAIYATYGNLYLSKDDAKKLYYCDLSNELNKAYVASDGISNSKAKSVKEFKFGEVTLLKIKNNKIVSYIEDVDTIKKELGI